MKEKAQTFRDIIAWQKAHQFVLRVYRFTCDFPKYELFTLVSQFRRAAISIPANITEGFVKRGKKDKVRFYNIAQGSLEECQYYLILASDLGYGSTVNLSEQLDEVGRLLTAYINAIRK